MGKERCIDRLDKYLQYKHLSDNKITVQLGLSIGTIGKSRKEGRDISDRVIEQILNYYTDLNKDWLLYGEGEMLNKKRIPLYDDNAATIGGTNELAANVDDSARPTEWINAGHRLHYEEGPVHVGSEPDLKTIYRNEEQCKDSTFTIILKAKKQRTFTAGCWGMKKAMMIRNGTSVLKMLRDRHAPVPKAWPGPKAPRSPRSSSAVPESSRCSLS